jgi:hypothetical protein
MSRNITLGKGSVYLNRPTNVGGIKMGSVFQNISNSTIINESTLNSSLNKIRDDGKDSLADALLEVAQEVEASKDAKAGELFNFFTDELAKGSPSKPVLKALWDGITSQLPHINSLASAIKTIATIL